MTDQEAFEYELALNRIAYEELKEQLWRDHAGQYVAIAFGRLIAACPSYDDALDAVKRLTPRPQHYVVFEGDGDPLFEVVQDSWTEFL